MQVHWERNGRVLDGQCGDGSSGMGEAGMMGEAEAMMGEAGEDTLLGEAGRDTVDFGSSLDMSELLCYKLLPLLVNNEVYN